MGAYKAYQNVWRNQALSLYKGWIYFGLDTPGQGFIQKLIIGGCEELEGSRCWVSTATPDEFFNWLHQGGDGVDFLELDSIEELTPCLDNKYAVKCPGFSGGYSLENKSGRRLYVYALNPALDRLTKEEKAILLDWQVDVGLTLLIPSP